jgi:hypothetical protein
MLIFPAHVVTRIFDRLAMALSLLDAGTHRFRVSFDQDMQTMQLTQVPMAYGMVAFSFFRSEKFEMESIMRWANDLRLDMRSDELWDVAHALARVLNCPNCRVLGISIA